LALILCAGLLGCASTVATKEKALAIALEACEARFKIPAKAIPVESVFEEMSFFGVMLVKPEVGIMVIVNKADGRVEFIFPP
jgi:hypothetical protein